MSPKEKRNIHISLKITPEEARIIHAKMEKAGIHNLSAYHRMMALNGFLLKLNLPELYQAVRLLGKLSSNVNQIARRLNERGSIYESEIDDIKDQQRELRSILQQILLRLNHPSG